MEKDPVEAVPVEAVLAEPMFGKSMEKTEDAAKSMDMFDMETLQRMSKLSPMFISVFLCMTSVVNQDVKALLWLVIVAFAVIVLNVIRTSMNTPNVPNTSSFFIIFSMTYLVAPMQMFDTWNFYVIMVFLMFFAMDTTVNWSKTTKTAIILAVIMGVMYGILWVYVLKTAGASKFLYFTTPKTNNVTCSKPADQTFKCYVYKNGEIISAI
jgi:hypothetical protein